MGRTGTHVCRGLNKVKFQFITDQLIHIASHLIYARQYAHSGRSPDAQPIPGIIANCITDHRGHTLLCNRADGVPDCGVVVQNAGGNLHLSQIQRHRVRLTDWHILVSHFQHYRCGACHALYGPGMPEDVLQ